MIFKKKLLVILYIKQSCFWDLKRAKFSDKKFLLLIFAKAKNKNNNKKFLCTN